MKSYNSRSNNNGSSRYNEGVLVLERGRDPFSFKMPPLNYYFVIYLVIVLVGCGKELPDVGKELQSEQIFRVGPDGT